MSVHPQAAVTDFIDDVTSDYPLMSSQIVWHKKYRAPQDP